jgi:DNA-binding protein HU-beta
VEGKLVNKSQLVDALASRYEGNRKAASQALEAVLDTITREVAKGEKVAITGFGSFEKRIRQARWVRNPQTGERIKAKKTAVPKFTAGADLKNVVSGAKKLPALAASTTKAVATKATTAARTTAKATPAKKTAKKATKSASKTSSATKSTAKKTAKKAPAKTATAKKTATKRAAPAKTTAKKTAKKTATKKSSAAKKSSSAKKTTTKRAAPAKKTAKKTAKRTAKKS